MQPFKPGRNPSKTISVPLTRYRSLENMDEAAFEFFTVDLDRIE